MPNERSDDMVAEICLEMISMDETRVQERAYLLWEVGGSLEGRLDEYWERACELIEDEFQSSYPQDQPRGHRT